MLNARPNPQPPDQPHPGSGPAASSGPPEHSPNRLNLLLSYAGWHTHPWIDIIPLILEPLGVRSLQAASGRQASQFIKEYPIHIAVVDLALPLEESSAAEAGPKLLELLRRLDQPPPTVVIKRARSHREDCREINAALRHGAFAVIDRPDTQTDLERLLEVLRRCLTRYYQGRWPGNLA